MWIYLIEAFSKTTTDISSKHYFEYLDTINQITTIIPDRIAEFNRVNALRKTRPAPKHPSTIRRIR